MFVQLWRMAFALENVSISCDDCSFVPSYLDANTERAYYAERDFPHTPNKSQLALC